MTVRTRTVLARKLRRDATVVERCLWRASRESALPWIFRRQHPIGRRIADFACPARKLSIELDGGQHTAEWAEDAARSAEPAPHLTPALSAPRGGEGATGPLAVCEYDRAKPGHDDVAGGTGL